MGDRAGAIQAYERSLQTLPTPTETHRALAILYTREGRLPEAREQADIALELGLTLPVDVWQALAREPEPPS
jgi:Flp pilus assembly protein TadD